MTQKDMNAYQSFIHKSRYARYLPEKKRREHWPETVDRYLDFITKQVESKYQISIEDSLKNDLKEAILNLEVMPSMRALMTAGKALERDNVSGYNCAFLPIDDPKSFDEAMCILMNGTGVGFSVERQYINQLPEIPEHLYDSDTIINVRDSKEGWSKALRMLISLLYAGEIPKYDVSKVRPAGSVLKVFGGRSSGPDPLVDLFKFVIRTFKNAAGRKLTSIECHDIMCKIADIVVVGGVRRCLPGFYKVKTKDGWKLITEVLENDTVVLPEGEYKVKNIFNQGEQKTVEIKTKNGSHISTEKHHWLAYDNIEKKVVWINADDIKKSPKGKYSLMQPK